MTTTVRQVYKNALDQPRPTCRLGTSGRFTDYSTPVAEFAKSGYIQNNTLFDGVGRLPGTSLHTDMVKTEYRMRYNMIKPFQKMTTPTTTGKLPKRYATYDHDI